MKPKEGTQIKWCIICSRVFAKPPSEPQVLWDERHKYCSRQCSDKAKVGVTHTPEHIEKIRQTSVGKKHSIETRLAMSGEKSHKWKGGKPHCVDCNKRLSRADAKRCHSCKVLFQTGENATHWQGGKTSEHMKIRNSSAYRDWRLEVFKRDEYQCQECGQIGGQLHADHIKPFAYFPEERLNVMNGRTLCIPCHKQTDTYLVKARWHKPLKGVAA